MPSIVESRQGLITIIRLILSTPVARFHFAIEKRSIELRFDQKLS